MFIRKRPQEKIGRWSTIDRDMFGRVARILKDKNCWRRMAPRLRMVCKHWRWAVDADGLHLSTRMMPIDPFCRSLRRICRESNVTFLAYYPQYGRLLFFFFIWAQKLLPNLQSLFVFSTDRAERVPRRIQMWRSSLRRLELAQCVLKQSELDALTQLVNVTDLRLFYVENGKGEMLDIGSLGKMTQLRRLSITDDFSVSRCFNCVSLLTGLETLEIFSRVTDVDGLSAIEYCSGLKKLRLSVASNPTSVDFVSRMTQLTALALSHTNTDVSLYPLRSIRSLALLSIYNPRMEEELRGIFPEKTVSIGVQSPCLERVRHFFLNRCNEINMPLTESLTSLSVIGYSITARVFRQLSIDFRHLQQIRMHLGNEPTFFEIDMHNVLLPRVTLWTIDMDWVYAGLFAARVMPSLKKLGIVIKKDDTRRHCCDHLTLLSGLEDINIYNRDSLEDDLFWKRMQDAFGKLPALEHLGWKQRFPNARPIPDTVMNFFAERNVTVDDDDRIFIDD